jgi:hypothetical protein
VAKGFSQLLYRNAISSTWGVGLILPEPIRVPGSRFATEYHGGKQGRFCYHRVVRNNQTFFEPVLCRKCGQAAVIFDEREVPYCPHCHEVHEFQLPSQRQPKTIQPHSRAKAYKKFRLYGQQSYKP